MGLDELFDDFIRRIRTGDDAAAEELVRTYEPLVRREIRLNLTDRRMVRSFDSVDVCQSIWSSFFVRMAAGQFDFESPAQLIRLLMAMAKNKLAFQVRHNRFQKRDVGRIDTSESAINSHSDNQPSPSECVSAEELYNQMQQRLTADELKISELRQNGLAWDEVAKALGGTAQARRMQLDRAADRVARQLGLK
jgi:RNA polymerase sigma-70 factor (ECF subfamily)